MPLALSAPGCGEKKLTLGFFEKRVNAAARAVFAQLKSFRIVSLVLGRCVEEAAIQFAASHSDNDSVALFHGFRIFVVVVVVSVSKTRPRDFL